MLKPLKALVYFNAIALTMAAGGWVVASAPGEAQPWALEGCELSDSWDAADEATLSFPGSVADTADWRVPHVDPQVIAAQAAQSALGRGASRFTRPNNSRSPFSTTSLRTGAARTSAFAGLASVPFMIGDTGAGTCLSFATIGYFEGGFSHPTLTCSRLNIAENNRALVSDRVYFSYRHFENASPGRVFQYEQNLNVDRYTLGIEKTLGEGLCSIELRVPLEDRLTSNPSTILNDANVDGVLDPGSQLLGGRDIELANISAIFKVMLAEHNGLLISGGLGVTAPTAQDVRYTVSTQFLTVTYPTLTPPLRSLNNFAIDTHFTNETWYLSPFLAWANRSEGSRFFSQGFLQVELPTNPTRVRFTDLGSLSAVTDDLVSPNPAPIFGAAWTVNGVFGGSSLLDLNAQPLMRINTGGGYYLIDESDNHNYFEQLVAMLELHYTTTLQDAKLSRIPLDFIGFDPTGAFQGAFDAFDPVIGNLNGRVDILNAVVGASARINGTTITNGFTMPLRSGDNRGFDFEYNLQIQRPF